MQEEAEDGSCNSSTPMESRSCWPVEGDLWAQAGEAFWTAGMGSGAHSQEENSSLTSTDWNKCRAFKFILVGVGFWRSYFHNSFITIKSRPLSRQKKYLQRVFSHGLSHVWKAGAGRNYCVVTLLLKTLHIIQELQKDRTVTYTEINPFQRE